MAKKLPLRFKFTTLSKSASVYSSNLFLTLTEGVQTRMSKVSSPAKRSWTLLVFGEVDAGGPCFPTRLTNPLLLSLPLSPHQGQRR